MTRIGVVGTGFIATTFVRLLRSSHPDLVVTSVLTRRAFDALADFPAPECLTHSMDTLVDRSDLVFECSGDVHFATDVVERCFEAGHPVVTMNSEFHVTTGSHFVGKGYLTEAEGDQPGCLAALREHIVQMGFSPLVYGNMKGFLDPNPSREQMAYWSQRQGISIEQTMSFTDGTKVQIEQALVANGLGATISRRGLEGIIDDDIKSAAERLSTLAESLGQPISDYALSPHQVPGVFIAARHSADQSAALKYLKLGPGPYYVIVNPHHLTAFEAVKTVRRALAGSSPLLNNPSVPRISVGAVAKCPIPAGTLIDRGAGGFFTRGEALVSRNHVGHVPICLIKNAVALRDIEPGELIDFADLELPDTRATSIARTLFDGSANPPGMAWSDGDSGKQVSNDSDNIGVGQIDVIVADDLPWLDAAAKDSAA